MRSDRTTPMPRPARDTPAPVMPEVMHAMTAAVRRAPARRRRWFRVGPGAALGVLLALVSGTALAATGQWHPFAGWNHHEPPSYTHARIPADQSKSFAILRTAQRPVDRSDVARALVRVVARQSGVRLNIDYVRFLQTVREHGVWTTPVAPTNPGPTYSGSLFIVPQGSFDGRRHSGLPPGPVLCMYHAADYWPSADAPPPWVVEFARRGKKPVPAWPTDLADRIGVSGTCASAHSIRTKGLWTGGGNSGDRTGLVPDGVARVQATTSDGITFSAPVVNNSYELIAPAPTYRIHQGSVRWLAGDGRVLRRLPS